MTPPQGKQFVPNPKERGAAVMVVIVLLLGLLAGGAGVYFLQVQSTKSTGLVKNHRAALLCAEAGLAPATAYLEANPELWDEILTPDPSDDPVWYPVTGNIDEGSTPASLLDDDFIVTVEDDGDGSDTTIIVRSTCTKYPETPRTIVTRMSLDTQGEHLYRNQGGQGAGNTGNAN